MTVVLEMQNVHLQAVGGAAAILRDVSLTVKEGDRLAIVGPSGSGKTHLLRLLNRLSEPSAGQIWYRGQALATVPVRQLRQRIALVLQESRLLGMTVKATLAYPLELQALPADAVQQRLMGWLERLHLPLEWMEARAGELSVGQRQWVAIARCLMMEPDVLLLDEPTAALDIGRGDALIRLLRDPSLSRPTTVLMVTHQLDLAEQFCNRVIYVSQGQIAFEQSAKVADWGQIHQDMLEAERQAAEQWDDADWA